MNASSSSDPPMMVLPPDITKDRTVFGPRLQLVFLGDSLTQRASEPDGWATLLAHYYSRKADALNRGYSGYNTNHVLAMVEAHIAAGVWPTNHAASSSASTSTASASTPKPTILTLCLGANDSCLPDGNSAAQSVPLASYRANLAAILTLLKGADGRATPDLHVIVIGPPQVDDQAWGVISKHKWQLDHVPIQRDNGYTRQFAAAAEEVAKEFDLPYIDMYARTSDWRAMLIDGLHYTAQGNYLVYQQLVETIRHRYPQLHPTELPLDGFPFLAIEGRTIEETRAFYRKATTNDTEAATATAQQPQESEKEKGKNEL